MPLSIRAFKRAERLAFTLSEPPGLWWSASQKHLRLCALTSVRWYWPAQGLAATVCLGGEEIACSSAEETVGKLQPKVRIERVIQSSRATSWWQVLFLLRYQGDRQGAYVHKSS